MWQAGNRRPRTGPAIPETLGHTGNSAGLAKTKQTCFKPSGNVASFSFKVKSVPKVMKRLWGHSSL